ncbi:unnamed protein product [Cylindrotheca closterium]|uniref:Uncharacterized protein n=1 Tax=Cylindrotheca closterium TaxID=2856 RepID=A0AAD2FR54_9STRA|nr:unnamed protein product [Cylindrotheca closterium]
MPTMKRLFYYVFVLTIAARVSSFVPPQTKDGRFDLCLSSQNDDHSMNEFSRTLNIEKILKTAGGNRRRTRDFKTVISATEKECHALKLRFELKTLHSLEADLSISSYNVGGDSRSNGLVTVYIEGTISASLTRICVRTNKEFVESFECKVDSLVKPTSNASFRMEDDDASSYSESKKKQNLKSAQINNLDDLVELQGILDASENAREDILEDEHIYSLSTGLLDVGELVAQNFWLALDPYPKLPGSDPVEASISG